MCKKWSGMTIGRILDKPAYTGDIVYGDVHVTDAHEALVDRRRKTSSASGNISHTSSPTAPWPNARQPSNSSSPKSGSPTRYRDV
jgi:hypothetical protein